MSLASVPELVSEPPEVELVDVEPPEAELLEADLLHPCG